MIDVHTLTIDELIAYIATLPRDSACARAYAESLDRLLTEKQNPQPL